jgi:hypothetical protein
MNNKDERLKCSKGIKGGKSPRQVLLEQKVLCNWGRTLKQSPAVHIQALVSADGILPDFCWLTSAFSY